MQSFKFTKSDSISLNTLSPPPPNTHTHARTHTDCTEETYFSSQPAQCINKSRLLYGSGHSFLCRVCRCWSRLFVGEGYDIILDALLLQLLQLFRCSFSVEGLGLHHSCVCYSCEKKDSSLSLSCFALLRLLFFGRMVPKRCLFYALQYTEYKTRQVPTCHSRVGGSLQILRVHYLLFGPHG